MNDGIIVLYGFFALIVGGIFFEKLLHKYLAISLEKDREKRDTAIYNRGQNYLFRIEMVLKNGREYDLQIYSNHLYQSIADLALGTEVFKLSEDGFIQRGQSIKLFYDEKAVWVESDDISLISMEIVDNPLRVRNYTCPGKCTKKENPRSATRLFTRFSTE